jgi:uncharacterized protein YcnI
MLRRLLLAAALVLAVVGLLASPAGAHVELEPGEAVAGSTETLTFSFHHGKDGSATTALEVQLPEGATVVEIPTPPVSGFAGVHDDVANTVRWSGGSVPDGTEADVPVVVELPSTPGVSLFPTNQETEAGDLTWISEAAGETEAPRLTLVADPNATTSTTAATTRTTVAVTTTEAPLPGTTLEAAQRDDGSTNAAPWIIGSAIVAIAAIAVGGTILKRRAAAADASPDGPDGEPEDRGTDLGG